MDNSHVFLNASEHLFNLGLSETIMLRNYARNNKFKFCSMIGGTESIRDIYEASNLDSDALEFILVESIFSIRKIFSAMEKVFAGSLHCLENTKIFINISTPDGMEMITDLEKIVLPSFLNKSNFVFNFDRRSLTRIYKNFRDSNFEYSDYEEEINPIIQQKIVILNNLDYLTSLSGGIEKKSIENILNNQISPNYIKTGLFSIPLNKSSKLNYFNHVRTYQVIEAKLLNLMKESLYNRYDYINQRQIHLVNYLVDSLI
tara:strand:- start:2438 stop:3214 length:777 start_codon:yes stop_codon:yes gene_type:complete